MCIICLICNEEVVKGDKLKCSKCNKFLHFGCAGLRETIYRKMKIELKELWNCYKCKNNKVFIKPKTSSFSDTTIENLVESVEFMSGQFESFKNQMKNILSTLGELQTENKIIRAQHVKIEEEILLFNKRINMLEQKSLECNIGIIGVPEDKQENCVETIKQIASKLKVELSVQNAFRVHSGDKNKIRKIVAIINSKENKRNLINEARKSKLTTKQVCVKWDNSNIYINEQLTRTNINLFYKTRTKAREYGYKFTYFKDSKIFVKKSENTNVILIDEAKSLSKIV